MLQSVLFVIQLWIDFFLLRSVGFVYNKIYKDKHLHWQYLTQHLHVMLSSIYKFLKMSSLHEPFLKEITPMYFL